MKPAKREIAVSPYDPEIAYVPLTKGKVAIVDSGMIPRISGHNWMLNIGGYAVRTLKDKSALFLHRVVAETPKGMFTDHINGNKLDNTRANLRVCTGAENRRNCKVDSRNSSKTKGAYKERGRDRWRAQIKIPSHIGSDKRILFLGAFATREEAAAAYDAKAIEFYGEFAKTNKMLGLI